MTASPLPGHAEQPDEIVCPSCGRFVGAMPKCPHCGARVEARISVRVFRYAALLLATVGLGLLYLMATHREIPIVAIEAIRPTMNFAYIRVAGKVMDGARVNYEGQAVRSVRFTVNDGTGDIPVTAFRGKGQELVDQGLIPKAGDQVTVTGSLSVSAERMALWLQAPEQLKIERATVERVALGDIDAETVGNTVVVEGTIVKVVPPRKGTRRPWLVTLKDADTKMSLTFWQDTYQAIGEKVHLAPGNRVRAEVTVGTFRDKIQLRVSDAAKLTFLNKDAAGD